MKCRSLIPMLGVSVVLAVCAACTSVSDSERPLIGVAFLVHGGFDERTDSGLWDSSLQIFSYDPNSFVYKRVIWSPRAWPMISRAGNAPKEEGKYSFEFERIGGRDPAMDLVKEQTRDLAKILADAEDGLGVHFMVDYMNWIGHIDHMPHPRNIYEPGVEGGTKVTYCGPVNDPWEDCDPERYNVDGTIDRMLNAGVDEIIVIDLTTSGVRFFKSNDAIRLSRRVIEEYNQANDTDVKLRWLNDPNDLMLASYPDKPAGWTNALGMPEHDPSVPLADNPNPVSSDPAFALLHAKGIEKNFNSEVLPENTGIMLINHATRRYNQLFDPKINDTLILNANIREQLLARNPGLKPELIVGSWMGIKQENPQIKPKPPAFSKLERTRAMRGENLGHAYLYETDEEFPDDEWGYLYWDALEYLKEQGAEHIVIAFPQITIDSVLNLVELPNQIAKEIGYRNWLYINDLDFETYPEVGHPFADYWGVWVSKACPVPGQKNQTEPCCFDMGGCADGRPYPPPRLTPITKARNDLDPSLAYDVSEYGHLGYDPDVGAPDKTEAVQQQYTGSWAIWTPPNADPAVAEILAKHVIEAVRD